MVFSNNKRLHFLSISEILVRYARSTFHFAVSKKGLCDKKQMISQLAKCAKCADLSCKCVKVVPNAQISERPLSLNSSLPQMRGTLRRKKTKQDWYHFFTE